MSEFHSVYPRFPPPLVKLQASPYFYNLLPRKYCFFSATLSSNSPSILCFPSLHNFLVLTKAWFSPGAHQLSGLCKWTEHAEHGLSFHWHFLVSKTQHHFSHPLFLLLPSPPLTFLCPLFPTLQSWPKVQLACPSAELISIQRPNNHLKPSVAHTEFFISVLKPVSSLPSILRKWPHFTLSCFCPKLVFFSFIYSPASSSWNILQLSFLLMSLKTVPPSSFPRITGMTANDLISLTRTVSTHDSHGQLLKHKAGHSIPLIFWLKEEWIPYLFPVKLYTV